MKQLQSVSYWVISGQWFDELIQEEFRKPDYQCVVEYEWDSEGSHTCVVGELSDKDRIECEEYLQNNSGTPFWGTYSPFWGTLLEYLAEKEIVPKGNYMLDL